MFLQLLKRDIKPKRIWDPAQHPRLPGGVPDGAGGRFTDKMTNSIAASGKDAHYGHVPGKTVSSRGSASRVFKELDQVSDEKTLYAEMLSPEEALRARQLSDKRDALLKAKQDTESLFLNKATGKYSEERRRLHRHIMEEFLSGKTEDPNVTADYIPKPGEVPRLLILGGRGGSGKSAFARIPGGYDPSKTLVLDADRIKSMLGAEGNTPRYEGWNAALFHEESSFVMEAIARHAISRGYNVVLDVTLKSPHTLEKPQLARTLLDYAAKTGYQVDGAYMAASRLKAQKNAIRRWQNGGPNGRLVPMSVIASNDKNEMNFDELTPGFDN